MSFAGSYSSVSEYADTFAFQHQPQQVIEIGELSCHKLDEPSFGFSVYFWIKLLTEVLSHIQAQFELSSFIRGFVLIFISAVVLKIIVLIFIAPIKRIFDDRAGIQAIDRYQGLIPHEQIYNRSPYSSDYEESIEPLSRHSSIYSGSSPYSRSPSPGESVNSYHSPISNQSAHSNYSPVSNQSAYNNYPPVFNQSPHNNYSPVSNRSVHSNYSPVSNQSAHSNYSPVSNQSAHSNYSPVSNRSAHSNYSPVSNQSVHSNYSPVSNQSAHSNYSLVSNQSAHINYPPVFNQSPHNNYSPVSNQSVHSNYSQVSNQSVHINYNSDSHQSVYSHHSSMSRQSVHSNFLSDSSQSVYGHQSPVSYQGNTHRSPYQLRSLSKQNDERFAYNEESELGLRWIVQVPHVENSTGKYGDFRRRSMRLRSNDASLTARELLTEVNF